MAALSDYLRNKLIDLTLRGQAFSAPTSTYVGLYTAAPTAAGGGTEVSGGAYARVEVAGDLASWAGTQGAGTTTASSGTTGATSNNATVTFPAPSGANWGVVTHFGVFDAASAGNLLFFGALTTSKTINDDDAAPSFAAGELDFSLA